MELLDNNKIKWQLKVMLKLTKPNNQVFSIAKLFLLKLQFWIRMERVHKLQFLKMMVLGNKLLWRV